MTLPISTAKAILRQRLGIPVKDVKYVYGFKTPTGRVLALHADQKEARLWYQPPEAPKLNGVRHMAPAKNADLNGPMKPLSYPDTPRVELEDADALHRFLDWYLGESNTAGITKPFNIGGVDTAAFRTVFQEFLRLVSEKSGRAFVSFDKGLAADWEEYKPRLHERAHELMAVKSWTLADIGSGTILKRVIAGIEIQDSRIKLTNNLVAWPNRYGHASRAHHVLLEATTDPKLCREIEELLYGLFCGEADEGKLFESLGDLVGRKYPLLAYLFFLKDMDRFMPIHPTRFDQAFKALNINFTTLRQCRWENYSRYNEVLGALRAPIGEAAGLSSVRLVDAHSFCWIFASLVHEESKGYLEKQPVSKDGVRFYGAREKSIIEMRMSVENTVKNSNGQAVQRIVKNKELKMTEAQLENRIKLLLDMQENRCALTGIRFNYNGPDADKNLLPSLDRINSDGHYEEGNLQVVCQFINFWKSDRDNEEFKRLLTLVRDTAS